VSTVAVVHHRVHMGISQNHVSSGKRPPSPIIWSMVVDYVGDAKRMRSAAGGYLRRDVATIGLAEGKVGIEGLGGRKGGSSEVGGSDLGGYKYLR